MDGERHESIVCLLVRSLQIRERQRGFEENRGKSETCWSRNHGLRISPFSFYVRLDCFSNKDDFPGGVCNSREEFRQKLSKF